MMFRDEGERMLAISQPAHAWISGQLMGRLPGADETLRLAGEQHDIAWLDWERAPEFDASAGRPWLFREVGGARHAPMWLEGVERALAAYGPQVALLISRHGGRIYRRFGIATSGPGDAEAIQVYLERQAPREAAWAAASGRSDAEIEGRSVRLAFVDALSLALCGALKAPLDLELDGATIRLKAAGRWDFRLAPWPFEVGAFEIEGEGRAMPSGGRFANEAAMRAWIGSPQRETFRARLAP